MKTNYLKIRIFVLIFCSSLLISGKMYGQCTDPVISSTSGPGSVCSGEMAMLTATHDGQEVKWYDAATGGNELATGDTFTTPPLTADSSFWAEALNSNTTSETGGRLIPTSTDIGTVSTASSPWGLSFDTTKDFTINSVDVYPSTTAGNLTVTLTDANYNSILTKIFPLPAGNKTTPATLNLNFNVLANNTYRLVTSQAPAMVREFASGHPGFPYAIGTVGSITGGTINSNPNTNSNVYYFFYNWGITHGDTCTSPRIEELVIVDQTPIPTGNNTQIFDTGDTLADLNVTGQDLQWYADDLGTTPIPNTTPLVDGDTYYVSQTLNNCEGELLAITVTENLSVLDHNEDNLIVYPTIAKDNLFIKSQQEVQKVEVFSLLGQKIVDKITKSSTITLDLNHLPLGTYLVKVFSNDKIKVTKIVKR